LKVGALVKSFIYLVSSSLLYPVLFLLSLLVLWMLFYAGAFLAEWLERRKLRAVPPQDLPSLLADERPVGVFSHRVLAYLRTLRSLLAQNQPVSEPVIENLLQETVSAFGKSLDPIRMLVRIAPGLGLIGTLIPMGTGLAALGEADWTKLSSDLVIAFTTTVVGLALGICAYFLHTIKRRWIEHDIRTIEFITEVLAQDLTGDTANEVHEEEESANG